MPSLGASYFPEHLKVRKGNDMSFFQHDIVKVRERERERSGAS